MPAHMRLTLSEQQRCNEDCVNTTNRDAALTSEQPTHAADSMVALSIRQPWAWLILHAGKDIENRSWPTRFRGRFLIHASKGMTRDEWADAAGFAFRIGVRDMPEYLDNERGGIVGSVELVNCVTESRSPWFCGEYGFVLRQARPLPFLPYKGALGFFNVAPAA